MSGWFYNDVSGSLNRVPTALEAPYLIPGTGWHELNISYNATRAQALAEAQKEFPNAAVPGGSVVPNVAGAAGQAAGLPNYARPLEDVGNFFHSLSQPATWVRVGEVALGAILLVVGLRALAHGSPVAGSGARKSATAPVRKTVKRVATVAAPEARLAGRVAAKRVAPKTTARVAAHRQQVAKYGAKKPYTPPAAKPAANVKHTTVRHVYHHAAPRSKSAPIRKHTGIPGKVGP